MLSTASRLDREHTASAGRAFSVQLPKKQRARRTNDPFAGLDPNSPNDRRVADLMRAYLAILGSPVDIGAFAAVRAAAELQVIAEQARSQALKSGNIDPDGLIRIQNTADRAVRELGIEPGAAASKPLSIREQLMGAK